MRAVALGDACDVITDGTHYTPTDVGSGVPFLTVKDLSDRGLDFDGCAHITESDFLDADAGRSAPRAGDVLFSKDGTVGKVHVVEEGRRFAVLSSLAILRPSEHVDSKFLGRMLATPHVLDQASKRKSGSAIRRIILSDLRKVMIPLPSLSEQRRIAAILDHADALRARRRQVLAHLDDLSQSLFAKRYLDASLERMPLSDLALTVTKGTTPTSVGMQFSSDGVRFLRAQNLEGGEVSFGDDDLHIDLATNDVLGRSQIYPADVLLSIAGTVGRVALVSEGSPVMNCNQAVAIIRLREPQFGAWLSAWLQSPDARRQIRASSVTATISNLSLGEIKQLRVPRVSFTTALEFAKESQRLSRMRVDGEAAAGLDDELFASLQSRAFRGEL